MDISVIFMICLRKLNNVKDGLLKFGKFLHIIDDDNRLNLSDIAFMIIMGKIAFSQVLDFPSVVTLATVLINKMHKRQQGNSMEDMAQVKEQVVQVQDVLNKITPIIDKVKEAVK